MSECRDCLTCGNRGLVRDCVESSWFVSQDTPVEVVYFSNEVISASGTINSTIVDSGEGVVQFLFRDVVVQSIPLLGDQSASFTVTGFNKVQIVGTECKNAAGHICLRLYFYI